MLKEPVYRQSRFLRSKIGGKMDCFLLPETGCRTLEFQRHVNI
jgi:hypothetical protein